MRAYYLAIDVDNDLVEFETNFHTGRPKAFSYIAEEAAEHIESDGDSETLKLFPMTIEIFNDKKKSLGKFIVEYVTSFSASVK